MLEGSLSEMILNLSILICALGSIYGGTFFGMYLFTRFDQYLLGPFAGLPFVAAGGIVLRHLTYFGSLNKFALVKAQPGWSAVLIFVLIFGLGGMSALILQAQRTTS